MHVGFLQGCALSPILFIILIIIILCCSQVVQGLCFDGLKILSLFFVVLLMWFWWHHLASSGDGLQFEYLRVLFTSEWRMRFTDGLVILDYYIVYCPF